MEHPQAVRIRPVFEARDGSRSTVPELLTEFIEGGLDIRRAFAELPFPIIRGDAFGRKELDKFGRTASAPQS